MLKDYWVSGIGRCGGKRLLRAVVLFFCCFHFGEDCLIQKAQVSEEEYFFNDISQPKFCKWKANPMTSTTSNPSSCSKLFQKTEIFIGLRWRLLLILCFLVVVSIRIFKEFTNAKWGIIIVRSIRFILTWKWYVFNISWHSFYW